MSSQKHNYISWTVKNRGKSIHCNPKKKRRSRRPRKGQLRTPHPHTNERGFQASWQ